MTNPSGAARTPSEDALDALVKYLSNVFDLPLPEPFESAMARTEQARRRDELRAAAAQALAQLVPKTLDGGTF